MEPAIEVQEGLHVLPGYVQVPTIGLLQVNAFLVKGQQPYLIDTGLFSDAEAFQRQVEGLIDLTDLRWIYLTHTDPDHIGSLMQLLERAPRAKLITTFIGLAKLQLSMRPVPPERLLLLNPGEHVDVGDRALSVMRPPVFDAPETTMVYDSRLDVLFSADSFGGPLETPVALANALPPERLLASQLLWAAVDAPWIHHIDRAGFAQRLGEIEELDPAWLLSTHLPPARRLARELCRNLTRAPDGSPFVGPNQQQFEAILRAAPIPPESAPPRAQEQPEASQRPTI